MTNLIQSFQGSKADVLIAVLMLLIGLYITVWVICDYVFKKLFKVVEVDNKDELRIIGNKFWSGNEKV